MLRSRFLGKVVGTRVALKIGGCHEKSNMIVLSQLFPLLCFGCASIAILSSNPLCSLSRQICYAAKADTCQHGSECGSNVSCCCQTGCCCRRSPVSENQRGVPYFLKIQETHLALVSSLPVAIASIDMADHSRQFNTALTLSTLKTRLNC
jgi:hypothetical protein